MPRGAAMPPSTAFACQLAVGDVVEREPTRPQFPASLPVSATRRRRGRKAHRCVARRARYHGSANIPAHRYQAGRLEADWQRTMKPPRRRREWNYAVHLRRGVEKPAGPRRFIGRVASHGRRRG
jgi:hypothetical protein